MPYVITSACIDVMDKTCLTVCPVDCIYAGGRMLYINPAECIDCGACESTCPREAIYFDEFIPVAEREFVDINRQVFARFDTSGDTSRAAGKIADHPSVLGR
jgi:NAD-dependent dihydropyrimidine dehydrogenase PreA subunit